MEVFGGGQESQRLHRASNNGVCISVTPYCLNVADLYRGEFQDNFSLYTD